jgi:hypothetical protein
LGSANGKFPPKKRAAVVTDVADPTNPHTSVSLCVFNPTGLFFDTDIAYGPGVPGCWEWPTFVPPLPLKEG